MVVPAEQAFHFSVFVLLYEKSSSKEQDFDLIFRLGYVFTDMQSLLHITQIWSTSPGFVKSGKNGVGQQVTHSVMHRKVPPRKGLSQ